MGFLSPDLPEVDVAQWRQAPRSERIRPLAQHIAERGLGTPNAVRWLQAAGIGLFVVSGVGFALTTKGIDGVGDIGSWWREPIVFEKLALWSLLFGLLGLGRGIGGWYGRLSFPVCRPRYWWRPGTMRLAPWPNRVPLTAGDTRTPVDTVLYGLLVAAIMFAMLSDGTGPAAGMSAAVGLISAWKIAAIVVLLALVGLRDRVVFLAAGGEVYGPLAVAFLFSGDDMIVAAKLVMVVMWVGAAASKLNKHFPFVLSIMMSTSPAVGPRWIKRGFFESFPDDLRPGRRFRHLAYAATFVECVAPLVMLFSPAVFPSFDQLPVAAAAVLVLFHLGVLSAMPIGVPLEWNVLMIFGICTLFIDKAGIGLGDLKDPVPMVILMVVLAGAVALGNMFPDKVWFLPPAMRYYAGNGDSALWCLKKSGLQAIEESVIATPGLPQAHFEKYYGREQAEILTYLGYAFRAMNPHGRALFTLADRAIPSNGEDAYTIVDGEGICSAVLGWNFGDGHLPTEQLIAALHRRCFFGPGAVRVAMLDAQPIHRQTQHYRIVDAATGEVERGVIQVTEMVRRQPWADDVPTQRLDS